MPDSGEALSSPITGKFAAITRLANLPFPRSSDTRGSSFDLKLHARCELEGTRATGSKEASGNGLGFVEVGLHCAPPVTGLMEMFRPAKFALLVPRTFTWLNILNPSPIRLDRHPVRNAKFLLQPQIKRTEWD